jgi:nitroreductase
MSTDDTLERPHDALISGVADAVLRKRYGTQLAGSLPEWNDTLETLLTHRSIRAYVDRPLQAGAIETLIAAAQSAPSSSNLQTWSVVAVENGERKARLSVLAGNQAHIRDAPLLLVWLADLARLEAVAARAGVEPEGLHYLETLLVGIIDAALAAQNAVVALESLGLGSVYIGAIRNAPEEVAAELALPPHVLPVFGLCVGYADPARPAQIKPRLPQSVVLHHERYDAHSQSSGISLYDEILAAFQAEQGQSEARWTSRSVERWRTRASLNGRDRLRDALAALGFELR